MSLLKENINLFKSDFSVTSVKEFNLYFTGNKLMVTFPIKP
jgi:hypothetical protein